MERKYSSYGISLSHFTGLERKVKLALNKLSQKDIEDIANYSGIHVEKCSRDLAIERLMTVLKK